MSQLTFHRCLPLARYLVIGPEELLILPSPSLVIFFLNLFRCWWVGPTQRETAGLAHPFSDPLGPSSFWQFSSPICFPLVFVKKKKKEIKNNQRKEKKQKPQNTSTPLLKQCQCGTKFMREHVHAYSQVSNCGRNLCWHEKLLICIKFSYWSVADTQCYF